MKRHTYIFLSTLLLIYSCSNKERGTDAINPKTLFANASLVKSLITQEQTTYEEIVESMQLYGAFLNKTKLVDNFEFNVHYQPHLFLAISNNDKINVVDKIDYKELKKINEYKNLHYLTFSIENKDFKSELLRYNITSAQEYSDRIMYYSFYCNKDAYLIENNKDTIKGSFVHFERTFDVSPKLNMTFVFERTNSLPIDKLNFVFEDIIFNHGKLNFEFDYKAISALNATEINKIVL